MLARVGNMRDHDGRASSPIVKEWDKHRTKEEKKEKKNNERKGIG